ncbi:MAG: BLUF domain-containing protein [Verrucomicrobiaceae bacterium]|nr:MAG: BLUF domain-containing protein [Verrucomicrobiaceae bacterium]HAE18248.1 hypothetical protein [Verrucomicrobiales bacterium]
MRFCLLKKSFSRLKGNLLAVRFQLCQSMNMSDELSRMSLLWETIQQEEEYPIFRLTYLSKPTKPFTDADFDDIESKSVKANNERDVTGLLVVNEDRILQILEGREEAVRELYNKIEADSRHTVLKLVCAVEDEVRLLMTWNMVVRGLNGTPPDLLDQFSNVFDDLLHAESQSEVAIDHIELFKEIALFGTIPEQV